MFKIYIFAATILFWVALSASLMQVQIATSPVYKMRVPTYRSMPIRPAVAAHMPQTNILAAAYN